MEKHTLTKSFRIKAPVSAVWHALTDVDMIRKYFFGTNVDTDWKEGSPIFFRGEWAGKQYEDKGTILKVVPLKLFKYNYWSSFSGTEDKPENYANITYDLAENENETVLTISQEGIRDKETLEHSEKNWESVINSLKELIEK